MVNADLTNKRVAIVATDYFEESELTSPLTALRECGANAEVIAPHGGEIKGLKHVEPGESVKVDKTLGEASPDDYDGLVIPGGAVNADQLRMDETARECLRTMLKAGKPVAIICHGPWLLASAGLAKGKRLTSYHTIQDDMRNAGANWVDEECVIDGNLITSRSPDDLPAFNQALIKALGAK